MTFKRRAQRGGKTAKTQKVTVRPSLIFGAGRGLFAVTDLSKGEHVCTCEGKDVDTLSDCPPEELQCLISNPRDNRFRVGNGKGGNASGHLINDRNAVYLGDSVRGPINGCFRAPSARARAALRQHQERSQQAENVAFGDNNFGVCALRDIKAGEELHYHYGVECWISQIFRSSDEPFTRVSCLLLLGDLSLQGDKLACRETSVDKSTATTLLKICGVTPSGPIARELGTTRLGVVDQLLHIVLECV